jgi:glycerophosphoryl diester phosphodiesterase
LRYDAVLRAEAAGFRLVRRLLDLGIETDAWTVNPGLRALEDVLPRLAEAGVRQITTDAPAALARQMRIALTADPSDRSLATAV